MRSGKRNKQNTFLSFAKPYELVLSRDDFAFNVIDDDQNIGPQVDLFMNDTNFISGGITDESPLFIANLFDSHGINTTGNGIGHDIVAILDDDNLNPIILNDYYESDIDNYKSGQVNYQFYNLTNGQHKISFKVWDVFNISSEKEIFFNVINSEDIITEILNTVEIP